MHFSTAAPLVCLSMAGLAAAQSMKFDWPDDGEKLNLTAPLKLDYTYSQGREYADLTQLDITFTYVGSESADALYSFTILDNHTLSNGKGTFEWDASDVLDAAAGDNPTLSSGKDHYFTFMRHEANSSAGEGSESPRYAIEAPMGVEEGSALVARPATGLFFLGLAAAAVAVL